MRLVDPRGRERVFDRALDVPGRVDRSVAASVVTAIRAERRGDGDREEDESFRYDGPTPGPLYDHVGRPLGPASDVSLRGALAAAARSRGRKAPQDDDIERVEREVAALDPETIDLASARRRVAETGTDVAALRERVSRLQGRLRECDDESEAPLRSERDEALTALTEGETEAIAARQALDAARRRARTVRDVRERRLRLQDERDNLARAARTHLARSVLPAFRDALRRVPRDGTVGDGPRSYEGDVATAALATVAVGRVAAPVVLEGRRFSDAAAAADVLDAPVVRIARGSEDAVDGDSVRARPTVEGRTRGKRRQW